MALFTGLIKCLSCGKNYVRRKERNNYKYVCSGWVNYGVNFCSRYAIASDDIDHIIYKHFLILGKGMEGGVEEYIKIIEVDTKNSSFTVFYTDGSTSSVSPNRLKY